MKTKKESKIFISHSLADTNFAKKIAKDLELMGHSTYFHEFQIARGKSIVEQISHAIENADFILIVLSENSVGLKWIEQEWEKKYKKVSVIEKKYTIPIVIQNCEIPELFKNIQYADFRDSYQNGLNSMLSAINAINQENVEQEIREERQPVDYNTLEYPIEILVQKYLEGIDEDKNEIFIPDYQREMTWNEDRQSKFIESVLLGLPIPYIFVADTSENEDLARLEIIDGTQRIRTLARFIKNEFRLKNIEKLDSLNGFIFSDLPLSRQRRFQRNTIRMIQLTEDADEEVRRDLFERINTGSVELNEMEKRRGSKPGKFLDLVEELSKLEQFRNLCSFTDTEIKKRDPQEFVLRFFAFLNNYKNYSGKKVHQFLDEYLQEANNLESFDIEAIKVEFISMLSFIEKYFPDALHIYRKTKDRYEPITRIKFESITVGVALALIENQRLKPQSTSFIDSEKFKDFTKGDGSSSQNKVTRRIEYVRDRLLGN